VGRSKLIVKIFVGTSDEDDIVAEQTLEYTLKKHSSEPIEITWMRPSNMGKWNTGNWGTPFSGFRWAVPSMCDFKGRAMYMDVDMICLYDIAEFWNMDMGENAVMVRKYEKRKEFSMLLFDCEKVKLPDLDSIKSFTNFSFSMSNNLKDVGFFDDSWNVIDGEDFDIAQIKVLHYSHRPSQPWRPKWYKGKKEVHKRPELVKLWKDLYKESQNN
jgi:hypothetical protein